MPNQYVPLSQDSEVSTLSKDQPSPHPKGLSKRSRLALGIVAFALGLLVASLFYVDRYTSFELPDVASLSYFLPFHTQKHPLHGIIAAAECEWSAKLARQSTTLYAAVEEYRRRYEREPPTGFDRWWAWTRANNVQLPDEYDIIDHSIRPFLGMSPGLFRARFGTALRQKDTFTLQVQNGTLLDSVTNWGGINPKSAEGRVRTQRRHIEPIAHLLEDFEAVWSPHDGARILAKYAETQALLGAERAGYTEEMAEKEYQHGWGFRSACEEFPAPLTNDSYPMPGYADGFLVDPVAAFSPCTSPQLLYKHGVFSSFNPPTWPLFPIFVLSSTAVHGDLMGVGDWYSQKSNPVPWEEKTAALEGEGGRERAVWRGSATGGYFSSFGEWRWSQRFRLVRMGEDDSVGHGLREGHSAFELSAPPPRNGREGVMMPDGETVVRMTQAEAADRYLDVGLTGKAIQCSSNEGTCADIQANTTFVPRLSQSIQASYKFNIDVDGNAWSGRFRSLLQSGVVVLKSTALPEWYTGRIQPWVHYVPIGLEYDELWDVMAFFTEPEHGEGVADAKPEGEEGGETREPEQGDASTEEVGGAAGDASGGGIAGHASEPAAEEEAQLIVTAEGGDAPAADEQAAEQAQDVELQELEQETGQDESPAEREQRRHHTFYARSLRERDAANDAGTASPANDPEPDTPARAVPPNDALAKKIGEAGKEYAETFWRQEDITAYLFRLYLEYARLGKEAGEGDYVYDPAHEV